MYRSLRRLLLAAIVVAGAGCDLPTEAPVWDTTWEFSVARDSIRTIDLLPSSLALDERGFVLDAFSVDRSVRLDQVCELCTCFDGPIPELELVPTDWSVQLPNGLVRAPIETGTARLVLTNRMGFDLLASPTGRRGFLRVELRDARFADSVVAMREVREPFPDDSTLVVDFDLTDVELTGAMRTRISGITPGSPCDLSLDPGDGLEARIELEDVIAPSALVVVSDADLAVDPREVEIPDFVAERLRPGESDLVAEVRIVSTLPAAVELDLSAAASSGILHGPEAALHTPVELGVGTVSTPVRFDRAFVLELDRLAGLDTLHFATRNRIVGNRVVTLTGGEAVRYEVRVRTRLPNR